MMRLWVRILYPQGSEQEHQESFRHRDIPSLDPVFNLLASCRSLGYP